MDYNILVNKDNPLPRAHIPNNLVDAESKYKEKILVDKEVKIAFDRLKNEGLKYNYHIDIESGYRDFDYQEKIYNKLLNEKGLAYTFRSIAKPGCSEHQTGLAIDICIYKDNKCYIEHELEDLEEIKWLIDNSYKYGFILRYPRNMEDKTGYNYEPWHFRYVGDLAKYLYENNMLLEDYYEKIK